MMGMPKVFIIVLNWNGYRDGLDVSGLCGKLSYPFI